MTVNGFTQRQAIKEATTAVMLIAEARYHKMNGKDVSNIVKGAKLFWRSALVAEFGVRLNQTERWTAATYLRPEMFTVAVR